ncbi:nucleoporin Nup43 isoform X1 [Manis pentadactyla]|uniref:nucleoporin Nup43 isoform X1 n=1 Tax=Manis pentadactyla TaxID=143292 RepID=UPI0018742FF4|nr:nucleoporin Nup43 isoform X1 [Manis pentadactyla]KAI5193881.1 Nucleoporin Nup43 [Manis pentadactyla]
MEEIYAKFVSQKISKTRWRPVPPGSLQTTETFATGSWDNEENYVSLWSIGDFGNLDSDGGFEGDHQLLCDIRHIGDVMDLQFFDQERIVAASSTGCITVFLHHPNNQTLSVSQQWTTAHYHTGPGSPSCSSAPCTGVVCNNPEIVTVGEDGRINLFRADHKEAVRTIDNADSSTLHAVTFLRTPEILTVNSIGQLKIWDFRQQGNEPSQILSLTGDRVPLHCVDRHPNQQHVVATGGQDGMLSIWDVRQGTMPVSLLKAHEAENIMPERIIALNSDLREVGINPCLNKRTKSKLYTSISTLSLMWEVHFHPSNPDHLFTCSEDGSLWHWDASADVSEKSSLFHQGGRNSTFLPYSVSNQTNVPQSLMSSWLSTDPAKDRIEITSLLPNRTLSVNSLDVLGPCLVCGTDAEAIYVTRQLFS